MSTILAIDPGRYCGYSVWEDNQLKTSGVINGTEALNPFKLICKHNPDVIVVEDWFIARKSGIKKLAYRQALWQALGESLQIPVKVVASNTWQSWTKQRRGNKKGFKKLATQLTRQVARNYPPPKDNEADAILIGWWALSVGILEVAA